MRFRPVMLLMFAITAALLPVNALASDFRLRVEDKFAGPNGHGVVLEDDDLDGMLVVLTGDLSANVTHNFTVGVSKPSTVPYPVGTVGLMFLQSFNITASAGATIRVTLEDRGFQGLGSAYVHQLNSAVSGNFCADSSCTGAVSFTSRSWASSSNAVPDLGYLQSTPGDLAAIGANPGTGTGALTFSSTNGNTFSGDNFAAFEDSGAPFSMFTQLEIVFASAGSIDFNQQISMTASGELREVPEPGTLMLIGTGLVALVARRRMMNV